MYFVFGNGIKEMFVFLPLVILCVIPSVCEGLHESAFSVVPKDQYIEVGSDTEILCQTSYVHGKVFWTLNNRLIDDSLSYAINSSHTVLSLRNFTHHSATIQCHSADTHQVIGGTIIRTYSKPRKISCILYYINQDERGLPHRFTCSWEHQIHPLLEINYTVLCGSYPQQSEICNSRITTCTTNYEDLPKDKINIIKNSTVVVRAKTAAWEAYSAPYEFDPHHILKIIRPVLNLTAFSDHRLVQWTRSPTSRKCHCQVKYSKAVNDRTLEWVLNKTLNPHEQGNVTIEKVESCSNYRFAVRCALDKAPWSDWSLEKTVLTRLNKSDVQLRLWRTVSELEKNGVRRVRVMWTELHSTCPDTLTYVIKQAPYKEDMTGVDYTDTRCGHSTCDVDVNQDAHVINLRVFNNEALFAEDSVYVPAIGESLPQVTGIQASTREGVILVSWKAPVEPVSGYMVDCTHNGNQYYWKESKYTNITLFDLLDKRPYNITVTPLFDDKTGHGAQALHICSRVGDPGNVSISIQAYDKSALVSLSVSQEACSGAVVNYTIFYSTQRGPQLNVTVDSTTRDSYLTDLKPDTEYSIYVKATALTGTTKSSERHFKTKIFDPRLITALSVCGSILVVLVLSLGLCCAVKWKKFKDMPFPNPGHSSVALWASAGPQQGMSPFQPFSYPSESQCDRVYTEEAQRTSTSPLPTDCTAGNPASDQMEEYTDPGSVPAPAQAECPAERVETQNLCSPGESTALLPADNNMLSPYRSQNSVEAPALRITKQFKHDPVKQQEKAAPVTVYVTLDMFEQHQGR
ncbi:interleukin-31 receptor subunit alpha-like [Pempheris klunzingeri]|uniref:interleukin-31 receptor subunit alpha-like n=1 Tax=Pempheris klunzingeri TaxID=3127111 RepID=UPI0039812BA2